MAAAACLPTPICGCIKLSREEQAIIIHTGNVLDVLPTLPASSVRCCVTSPPYWGLRDYGTATWTGGDPDCPHMKDASKPRKDRPNPSGCGIGNGGPTWDAQEQADRVYRDRCPVCGAERDDLQLGLEDTPEQYVANLVRVFRDVRRVLTDDGTLWLNLGDSYAGSGKGAWGSDEAREANKAKSKEVYTPTRDESPLAGNIPAGLKPKDMVGIPWRVAFALQADGWYLRSDIIWAKPNPMPESVTDRPTKSHEYIFLLSKSARYYYDHQAIAERAHHRVIAQGGLGAVGVSGRNDAPMRAMSHSRPDITATRNRRTVWTITTQPFPDAHFAVFPETIPSLCIQAGTAIGDTVLDPFAGAGTTGVVAQKLGREFIGVELNPVYAEMARDRINGSPLSLFAHLIP